jgi:succinate-semialdehyde dehydrogenase/glutarate-semialdehyde dehydrogenase
MYHRFGLFVAGEWRQAKSGAKVAIISAVAGASLGEAPVARAADADEALYAAEAAPKDWRATPAFTRADALHAVADEMIAAPVRLRE